MWTRERRFSAAPPSSPAGSGCSQYSTPSSASAGSDSRESPRLPHSLTSTCSVTPPPPPPTRVAHVHLQRERPGAAPDRADALHVEPVATTELELETLEAGKRLLGSACHVVGIAEPDRPAPRAGRRAAAPQL